MYVCAFIPTDIRTLFKIEQLFGNRTDGLMFRGQLEELVYWMVCRFYEKIAIGQNHEEKNKN